MKKSELRQLVRELIKEAYVDSKGELKRFKTIDDEEGEGTTEWLGGLQRVINFIRSIPKLKELKFTEPMVRLIKEIELVYNFYVDGSEEKTKMLNSIPGNNIGQKAEMAALGTIMMEHDMIFNLYILPHLEKFNPDLPGLGAGLDDEDGLFEALTITKFDLDALKTAGKIVKSLGVVKEAEIDAAGNLVGFSGGDWKSQVDEYDHIHFFIEPQMANRLEDKLIMAGIDMVDNYPYKGAHLLRVSLGSNAAADLVKAEKIVGQSAKKGSPEDLG